MPTVLSVAADIERKGETVVLTRRTDAGSVISASPRAFVRGYKPEELGGGIIQGDRELRIAPGKLALAGWPDSPRKPDQVQFGDGADVQTAVVQSCELRRLGGQPALLVVQVRGG